MLKKLRNKLKLPDALKNLSTAQLMEKIFSKQQPTVSPYTIHSAESEHYYRSLSWQTTRYVRDVN